MEISWRGVIVKCSFVILILKSVFFNFARRVFFFVQVVNRSMFVKTFYKYIVVVETECLICIDHNGLVHAYGMLHERWRKPHVDVASWRPGQRRSLGKLLC